MATEQTFLVTVPDGPIPLDAPSLRELLARALADVDYGDVRGVDVTPLGSADGNPTARQGLAFADLFRRFRALGADVARGTGGLPDHYLYVGLRPDRGDDFHAGISPSGEVSS